MKIIKEDTGIPLIIKPISTTVKIAVIVAALGYFVDIFDLLLFSIVRVPSLHSLGFEGQELTDNGIFLLNVQMIGLLIGGVFWGVLGDKKGRLFVLFGSIFFYSVANIANGFVHSIEAYATWRFIAGLGLAGELGAGITLVSELMPRTKRGYATTIIAVVGVSGAIVAFTVAEFFDWRISFFIGGSLGICLLLLRVGVAESGMFGKSKNLHSTRGDFLSLFTNKNRFFKYLRCIAIGVPLWYVVGILITLSPEFGRVLNIRGEVSAGTAVACCYAGMAVGDLVSGILSQYLKSRIKVVYAFLLLSIVTIAVFFFARDISLSIFYIICFSLGFSIGYMVIFLTIATEQFGTNIRATVTTTVPNFVRGSLVPIYLLFQLFNSIFNDSMLHAGIILAVITVGCAFWALSRMDETFSKDLDYTEE